jgi:hypothetical protein
MEVTTRPIFWWQEFKAYPQLILKIGRQQKSGKPSQK